MKPVKADSAHLPGEQPVRRIATARATKPAKVVSVLRSQQVVRKIRIVRRARPARAVHVESTNHSPVQAVQVAQPVRFVSQVNVRALVRTTANVSALQNVSRVTVLWLDKAVPPTVSVLLARFVCRVFVLRKSRSVRRMRTAPPAKSAFATFAKLRLPPTARRIPTAPRARPVKVVSVSQEQRLVPKMRIVRPVRFVKTEAARPSPSLVQRIQIVQRVKFVKTEAVRQARVHVQKTRIVQQVRSVPMVPVASPKRPVRKTRIVQQVRLVWVEPALRLLQVLAPKIVTAKLAKCARPASVYPSPQVVQKIRIASRPSFA